MSKVIEVTLYEWDELSQTAKDRARMKYTEHLDYEWWDSTYDYAIEEGGGMGFDIEQINFSGFYSQGDGARWVGRIDVAKWLGTHVPDCIGVSALIALIDDGYMERFVSVRSTGGNYCHENTMDISEVEYDDRLYDSNDLDEYELEIETIEGEGIFQGMTLANMRDIINTDEHNPHRLSNIHTLNQAIEESAKQYASTIYQRLKEDYEYLCSEEAVAEHFKINEVYFTEEGEVA